MEGKIKERRNEVISGEGGKKKSESETQLPHWTQVGPYLQKNLIENFLLMNQPRFGEKECCYWMNICNEESEREAAEYLSARK